MREDEGAVPGGSAISLCKSQKRYDIERGYVARSHHRIRLHVVPSTPRQQMRGHLPERLAGGDLMRWCWRLAKSKTPARPSRRHPGCPAWLEPQVEAVFRPSLRCPTADQQGKLPAKASRHSVSLQESLISLRFEGLHPRTESCATGLSTS